MNTPSSVSPLTWRQADDDVYVATSEGEYAGFVATTADGVEAHGALGEPLGLHVSSALARAAVACGRGTAGSRPRMSVMRSNRPRGARSRGNTGRVRGPKE